MSKKMCQEGALYDARKRAYDAEAVQNAEGHWVCKNNAEYRIEESHGRRGNYCAKHLGWYVHDGKRYEPGDAGVTRL
jgi:hypothetical protein